MTCLKFSRQYLHMVLSGGRGLYSLCHMDVSRLFYPSKEEAKAAQARDKENGSNIARGIEKLPEPSIHYEPFSSAISYSDGSRDFFAPYGKSHILCYDSDGHTSMYNTEEHCVLSLPRLNSPKGPKHITVCIPRNEAHFLSDFQIRPNLYKALFPKERPGDHMNTLYVMDMDPYNPCSFEALTYYPISRWRWRRLPTPPFFADLKYRAHVNVPPVVVVDGTKIFLSSDTATYCFDTGACEWSKAGDWVLPFRGNAEYIPELGLWLGLSADKPYNLCSMNLSSVTMGSSDTQPLAQNVAQDVDLPEDCMPKNAALLNMGLGRFCIAKFFDQIHDRDNPQLVLTGVELDLDGHKGEGVLSITKHKSECLASDSIICVL